MALSAIRRAVWRQLLPDGRSLWQSALAMALALALAGVVLLAAVSGSSLKPAALVLAVMILPVAAQASGNPRLLTRCAVWYGPAARAEWLRRGGA